MTVDDVHLQGGHDDAQASGVMFTRQWQGDDVCTLEIRGNLDIAISGLLRQELDDLLDLRIARLDVDLSGVLFMDSSALSALVQANDTARGRHQQFNLLRPSPACSKVLSITGLDRAFGLS